jgi:hypothetical protein
MMHWLLPDIQILIAAIFGLTLVLLVIHSYQKRRVTRGEFAFLQEEVSRLSEEVKTLHVSVLRLLISNSGHSTGPAAKKL